MSDPRELTLEVDEIEHFHDASEVVVYACSDFGVSLGVNENTYMHASSILSAEQVRTVIGMLQQALQWHLEEIGETVSMRPTLHLRQITREVPGAVLTVLQQQWTNDDQSAIEWRDVPLVKE